MIASRPLFFHIYPIAECFYHSHLFARNCVEKGMIRSVKIHAEGFVF